jgi:hypothetical protein
MSLCKNCGWWKKFDCIFEFSVKGYVRNTINLSCAKILLPSVIINWVVLDYIFCNLYIHIKITFINPSTFVGVCNKFYDKCIFFLHCLISPFCPLTYYFVSFLDSVAQSIQVQTRQPGFDVWQGHLFTEWLWLADGVLRTYVPHLMCLIPFQCGFSIVIENCKIQFKYCRHLYFVTTLTIEAHYHWTG